MQKRQPLIALAINNDRVLSAVKNCLEQYFLGSNRGMPVDIVGSDVRFEKIEGIEPLVHYAYTLAETARINNGARIGLAASWGTVTIRDSMTSVCMFESIIVVATCESGLIAAMTGMGTFPEEMRILYAEALSRVILPMYPETVDEAYAELQEIGHLAAAAWSGLEFEAAYSPKRILLN